MYIYKIIVTIMIKPFILEAKIRSSLLTGRQKFPTKVR